MKKFTKYFGLLALVTSLSSPAKAEVRLSQIETYLNKLTTLEASFKQWDPNGALTTGTLYLHRPGRIRMNYQAPSKLVILGDGETLFFADRETGDLSYTPITQSPAAFLLDDTIDFQGHFSVDDFIVEGGKVKLTLRRQGNDDLGALTLVFKRSPSLQLIQWIISDAQNKKTIVNLEDIKEGQHLKATLFDSSILRG